MSVQTWNPSSLQVVDDDDIGVDLLGEVISWESPQQVTISKLRDGLRLAGFPETMARDMLPRNAWLRAAHKLEDGRVIRKVEDAGGVMIFQFTKEYFSGTAKEYSYNLETMLTLEKATGRVSCTVYELETQAQKLIDEQMGVRSSSDVTRIVQTICRSQADLFPIRKSGGVYFVPERHAWVIGSLGVLMNEIGGTLIRFPVPAGNETGRISAAKAIRDELKSRISEHLEAIEGYTEDAPEVALAKRSLDLVRMQGEIEGYQVLLEGLTAELHEHLAKARDALIQKMVQASQSA